MYLCIILVTHQINIKIIINLNWYIYILHIHAIDGGFGILPFFFVICSWFTWNYNGTSSFYLLYNMFINIILVKKKNFSFW